MHLHTLFQALAPTSTEATRRRCWPLTVSATARCLETHRFSLGLFCTHNGSATFGPTLRSTLCRRRQVCAVRTSCSHVAATPCLVERLRSVWRGSYPIIFPCPYALHLGKRFPLPEGWSAPFGPVSCVTSKADSVKILKKLRYKGATMGSLPWEVREALVGLEPDSTQLKGDRQIKDKERLRIIGNVFPEPGIRHMLKGEYERAQPRVSLGDAR